MKALKPAHKYKPGDRVIALRWPRNGAGTIVKPARVHPLVRWDGYNEDKRVQIEDIRPEMPADIAKREHAQQVSAWKCAEPPHSVVVIERDWYSGQGRASGFTVRATTAAQMRAAADELRTLADWFEKRPELG